MALIPAWINWLQYLSYLKYALDVSVSLDTCQLCNVKLTCPNLVIDHQSILRVNIRANVASDTIRRLRPHPWRARHCLTLTDSAVNVGQFWRGDWLGHCVLDGGLRAAQKLAKTTQLMRNLLSR
jgi:hypothetical protein